MLLTCISKIGIMGKKKKTFPLNSISPFILIAHSNWPLTPLQEFHKKLPLDLLLDLPRVCELGLSRPPSFNIYLPNSLYSFVCFIKNGNKNKNKSSACSERKSNKQWSRFNWEFIYVSFGFRALMAIHRCFGPETYLSPADPGGLRCLLVLVEPIFQQV